MLNRGNLFGSGLSGLGTFFEGLLPTLLKILPKRFMALVVVLILSIGSALTVNAAPVGGEPRQAEFKVDAAPAALFSPMKAQADAAFVRDREVVRSRQVDIDINLLTSSVALSVVAAGRVISLNLFDDVNFVAEPDRVERTSRGVTWVGRLRGIDLSQVVIVVNGGVVVGNISMPAGRYHIRFAGNGVHEVQQIDQSLFPPDEPFVPIPLQQLDERSSLQKRDAQADDGSTIDVMVVYSATTRAAAGGAAAMQALIDLAINETNQSYQSSGIVQRLRLVHSEEVAYTETGNLNDTLNCITRTTDGCIDNIHALRNTYGADLVSFWVENGSACGVAWLMTTVSSSFSIYGFSTVTRTCATGNYSFGHELGHNMGADHDVYVASDTTAYPYAHGYTYTAAASPWRTVMAYNNACQAVGKSCTRIQYWSNPSLNYGGAAMGNATADNRQTLNNTAYTIANFRASGTAGAADCVFNWAEFLHPNLFAPAGAVSQTLTPYYYRYYAGTNAYLGTSSADNQLYYLGPASGNTLLGVGPLSDWRTTAGCP